MYEGPGIYKSTYGIVYATGPIGSINYSYTVLEAKYTYYTQHSTFKKDTIMWNSLVLLAHYPVLPTPDSHPEFFI
jgi:hypothetical protein